MAKRLLVTDDALIIREMIKQTLQEAGWEIAGEAKNGKEAIESYAQLKPDAVTLDLVMPDYDGLHALEGIIDLDHQAKVVVVSAVDQKEILKRAFSLGAADFVVKPFDGKRLVATLETATATG